MPTNNELTMVMEYCQLTEMTKKEISEAVWAINFIDSEFGALRETIDNRLRLSAFIGAKPKSRLALNIMIRFSNMLNILKSAENYSVLLEKLKGTNESFNEGLTLLQITSKFAKAGIDVSFVIEDNVSNAADFILIYNGMKIIVEVSRIRESPLEQSLSSLTSKITMRLARFSNCYAGIINLPQKNPSMLIPEGEVLSKLDKHLRIARAKGGLHKFKIGDVIEFAVSVPYSPTDLRCRNYEDLKQWIDIKNGEYENLIPLNLGSINRRYYTKPILDRIEDKIKREARQTRSAGSHGMVILVNEHHRLSVDFFSQENINQIMLLLERKTNSSKNLFAVGIYDEYAGAGEETEIGDNTKLFLRKTLAEAPETVMMQEQVLITFNQRLINNYNKIGDKIIEAFKKY